MSIHKFAYMVESLQKDKIEILENELEPQSKFINIKVIDMSNELNTYMIEFEVQNVEEIQLKYGEKKIKYLMQRYS